MIKNFISGALIGIANIIPGVSGGTIIVLLGIFDKTIESISNFKKKQNVIFLIQLGLGIFFGLVFFSKILEILFKSFYVQTMFWFIGMIVVSIIYFLKEQINIKKINKIFLILGLITMFIIFLIAPEKKELVYTIFPSITFLRLLGLIFLGICLGVFTIFPGISGSMMMLVINQYYLLKSYMANILSFKLEIIIPIIFLGFGLVLGFYFGAKLINYLLKKYKYQTLSYIVGLIIMSIILLVPTNVNYTLFISITSLITFLIGIALILFISKIKKAN